MLKREEIQKGIKKLTLSTSVRWFGWGLGEAFIPVFLLLFSVNFLEAGILASIYHILFFISIPLVGYLADNIKTKTMILAGLVIYVFIGMGYFLAGMTGAIIFIALSRGLNGISYSLDQVGRESYFMKNSSKKKISQIFGQFDFITNFWWIFAVFIGLFFVKFFNFQIHWLLFFIVPTSIVSFLIVLKLKEKNKEQKRQFPIKKIYFEFFKKIKNFNIKIKIILILSFLKGILSSIIYFFVPISTYLNGGSLINAAILALVYSIPSLFGKFLGKIADKKRLKIYFVSFFFIIIILISLAFIRNYLVLLGIMFISSIIFELVSLTNKGMVARFAERTHLGETDGSLNGISALGAIIGPVLFGLLLDLTTQTKAYLLIIFIAVIGLLTSFIGIKIFKK